jgi:hypothetical protein
MTKNFSVFSVYSTEICGISTISSKEIGRIYMKIKNSLPKSAAPESIAIKDLVVCFVLLKKSFS